MPTWESTEGNVRFTFKYLTQCLPDIIVLHAEISLLVDKEYVRYI
jgi:hypothetical protein